MQTFFKKEFKKKEESEIQVSARYLADICLKEAQEYHNYEDKDLMNATLIFQHFFMDMIFKENQDLTQKGLEELSKTAGEAIRELIKSATGKDTHQLAKN